jgi:hypothetical protein
MCRAALAIISISALLASAPVRGQTYDPTFPVCMQIYGPVGYQDCRYASMEQCRYLAVGRSATCIANPYFAPTKPAARRHNAK